jgi:hypothetical protein
LFSLSVRSSSDYNDDESDGDEEENLTNIDDAVLSHGPHLKLSRGGMNCMKLSTNLKWSTNRNLSALLECSFLCYRVAVRHAVVVKSLRSLIISLAQLWLLTALVRQVTRSGFVHHMK